jgi:hypothetical protein
MKPWITLTAFVMSYFLYGFYLSQSSLTVIPTGLQKSESTAEYYDYRGVTNVRTDLSNGSSSPAEVIAEAKVAGLDYLILTDINQFNLPTENLNSYNGNLLVIRAGEYSFLDSRLLYYDVNPERKPDDPGEASMYFTDVLSQKYSDDKERVVVLSHPFRKGGTWTGAYPPGLDGIEILNPKAVAENAWNRSKLDVLWSFIIYPFNPRYSFLRLFREPSQEIGLWDQLSKNRPTLAFGGSDASARAIPWANALLKFPSYEKSFEITSNHVLLSSELTGSYQKDRQKIFTALKRGNFYVSLDLLGDPKGFIATIDDREKKYLMGETVRFNKNLKLKASIPIEPKDFYELVVFKNGERDLTVNTTDFTYSIPEPGIYRVVVRVSPFLPLPEGKKWVTWIYTNNFYVR